MFKKIAAAAFIVYLAAQALTAGAAGKAAVDTLDAPRARAVQIAEAEALR